MAYNEIADTEIQPNAPITTSLMTRLRDNPLVRSMQIFTTSGTWARPQGCEQAIVIVVGGGGGGASTGGLSAVDGDDGGNSSFGSHALANGGFGGLGGGGEARGGRGVTGDILLRGDGGGLAQTDTVGGSYITPGTSGGFGGGSFLSGQRAGRHNDGNGRSADSYGGGGSGGYDGGVSAPANGGAGAGTAIAFIQSGLGSTETVTIGAGGAGGAAPLGTDRDGGDGHDGIVIVWELYGND